MNLSEDSLTILLLCSRLALGDDYECKPLKLNEWNHLVKVILGSDFGRPEALLDMDASELIADLQLDEQLAERIECLLNRKVGLSIELERLESSGIWVITRADPEYPQRYKRRLKGRAPVFLFGAGERALLGERGLAIVGSRNVDAPGEKFAQSVGNAAAFVGLVVYSGGARGVDQIAMQDALDGRGTGVGVLAHSLAKSIRNPKYGTAIRRGDVCLITSYSPDAGFSAGNAMGRNKLIYCLADYALVVASDLDKGGTWGGASEVLKNNWLPVFVRDGDDVPDGNKALITKGGIPIPEDYSTWDQLDSWLEEKRLEWEKSQNHQLNLFDQT
jgi:predicted Rossmann fold nucleotide-binding protein DprA/Smf involved in DNA uptake